MKTKTKIIKIKFTKKEQEEIDLINQGKRVPTIKTITDKKTGVKRDIIFNHRFTFEGSVKRLRDFYGGTCRCGAWPSYKMMYDVGDKDQGAWLVSRFCNSCYDKLGLCKKK